MKETFEKSKAALGVAENILTGVRSALLAERDATKKSLRQSTEFVLVGFQAELESAAALIRELTADGEKQPSFSARVAAAAKSAEFVLARLSGLLLALSAEEPLFHSYERIGENLSALSRAAATLRGAGPGATQEIMSAIGVR